MAFLILLICVIAYALGTLNVHALACRYMLGTPLQGNGYLKVLRQFHWKGVFYVLVVDVIRCLLIVLIGGLLLKGKGFTHVGQFLAILFALLGQALPLMESMHSRTGLVMAALLLLFTDWRIFLICFIVAAVVYVWQKRFAVAALASAIVYPIAQLIFKAGAPVVILSLISSLVLVYIYRSGIFRFFRRFRKAPSNAAPRNK